MTLKDPRVTQTEIGDRFTHMRNGDAGPSTYHDQVPTGSDPQSHDVVVGPACEPEEDPMGQQRVSQLIRDVLRGLPPGDRPDPSIIAKTVRKRLTDADLSAAVDEMIGCYVQTVLGRQRMLVRGRFDKLLRDHSSVADEPEDVRSPKLKLLDKQWNELLDTYPVYLGPGHGDWKILRHCTADDLELNAGVLRDQARRTAARATSLENFAGFLRDHGIETVGEIPVELRSSAFAVFNLLGAR